MIKHLLILFSLITITIADFQLDDTGLSTMAPIGYEKTLVGKQRVDKLSELRNAVLNAIKKDSSLSIDSILIIGDFEFSSFEWLTNQERILIFLITGNFENIINNPNLRNEFWKNGNFDLKWKKVYPSFCPEEAKISGIFFRSFDFAPDLGDHLLHTYREKFDTIQEQINTFPDLKSFLALSSCTKKLNNSYPNQMYLTKQERDNLLNFIKTFPNSKFSSDMVDLVNNSSRWTGNGWLIGAGPRYGIYDEKTNFYLSNGIHGGFFSDLNFPRLKVGLNFDFRSFKSLNSLNIDDTTFAKGFDFNFFRFGTTLGESFGITKNLFITPYTGLLITSISTLPDDEKNLSISEKSANSVGIPIGIKMDYLLGSISANEFGESIKNGYGLRFNIEYDYGRWSGINSKFGDNGFVFGVNIFWGLIGFGK